MYLSNDHKDCHFPSHVNCHVAPPYAGSAAAAVIPGSKRGNDRLRMRDAAFEVTACHVKMLKNTCRCVQL